MSQSFVSEFVINKAILPQRRKGRKDKAVFLSEFSLRSLRLCGE
jgi:hypothetical protein